MKQSNIIISIIGILIAISLFFIPYLAVSKSEQVIFGIGIITFILVAFLIFIISNKFKEINELMENQKILNKKNEERFKIYKRLTNNESKIRELQREVFKNG